MKKSLSLLLVVALMFSLLAGCASGTTEPAAEETPAAETEAPAETETETEAPAGDGQEIAVWMGAEDARFMLDSGLPEKFEEETGYKVNIVELPWDTLHDKLLAGLSGGELPVVANGEDLWIGEFSLLGGLREMDSFRDEYGHTDDKYLPKQWDHFRSPDGKIYAAPAYNETRVLFYRKDLFEAAGIAEPPTNFDELVETGLALSNGEDQFGLAYYDSWLDVHQFTWILAAKGGSFTNDDYSKCTLDSPEALEAFKFYASLFEQDIIPKDPTKRVEGFKGFREGYYAMAESGAWWFGLLNSQAPEIADQWTAVVLPEDETTLAYGHPNPWFVPTNADNPDGVNKDAADAWINFMLTVENALTFHEIGGFMPPMLEAYESPIITENPNAMVLYEAGLRGTYSLSNVPNAQMIQEQIWTTLADIRDDVKTPEQASQDLTAAIDGLLQ